MATISAKEQPGMHQIDLMNLNIQQLTQLKNQLNQVSFCMQITQFIHLYVLI